MSQELKTHGFSLDETLMAEIEEHAYSNLTAEVGGVLMGRTKSNKTSVHGFIPALAASAEQATLTFTHDVWEDILRMAADQFPDLQIVGWYHTHPTFGIFLSEYDLFIQQNFFNSPRHLALVIDPVQGQYGWFVNKDGGEVEQIVTGMTATGPKRSTEPILPELPSRTSRLKFWSFGVSSALVGAAIGAGVTLAQAPPDLGDTLLESRDLVGTQAETISSLEQEISRTHTAPVLVYAGEPGDDLLSIADQFYFNQSAGLRAILAANDFASLAPFEEARLIFVPQPDKTSLAEREQQGLLGSELSQQNSPASSEAESTEPEPPAEPEE